MPDFEAADFESASFEAGGLDDDPIEEPEAEDRDVEADCKEELTEVQRAFRERAAVESSRKEDFTDTSYYAVVCFQLGEQTDAFLEALGLDKDSKYIDGVALAAKLGLTIPPCRQWPKTKPFKTSGIPTIPA